MTGVIRPAFETPFKAAFGETRQDILDKISGLRIAEALQDTKSEPAAYAEFYQNWFALRTQAAHRERKTLTIETLPAVQQDDATEQDPTLRVQGTVSAPLSEGEASGQLSMTLSAASSSQEQYMLTDAFTDSGRAPLAPKEETSEPDVAPEILLGPVAVPSESETDENGDRLRETTDDATATPSENESYGVLSAWSDEDTSAVSVSESASDSGETEPEEPDEATSSPSPSPTDVSEEPARVDATTISDGENAIDGGRVTTFEIPATKEISSVYISDMPEHGHASVNPDNSIAVVMTGSDYTGPLSLNYVVNYSDGTFETKTLDLNVLEGQQERGWGDGSHYMLEEDATGDLIVETGENHRKVFVTGGDHGLTRADIAERENLSEATITDQWLVDHAEYGGSEDLALSEDVAKALWERMSWADGGDPVSHWAMFERGYTYDTFQINLRGLNGESDLHPVHFTAWGEGDRPIIETEVIGITKVDSNYVLSDLSLQGGVRFHSGDNVILHNVEVTDKTIAIQNMTNVTINDSQIHNVVRDAPQFDDWNAFADRETGLYIGRSEGILIDGSTFHHNAWAADYEDEDGGQPPSLFSHNIYIQYNVFDVTFTDNIVSQGASYGAQFRGGVWAQDNAFVDNNAGVNFLGGVYNGSGPIGNYTYFTDNVITSAGHKEAEQIGALAWGAVDGGYQSTLLDNIIAHLADPNNPFEIEEKYNNGESFQSGTNEYYNNTIIYGWHPSKRDEIEDELNQNVEDLDPALLDRITIQRFAAEVLGDANASIGDLMDYILSLPEEEFGDVSASDIIAYFQQGFGLESSETSTQDSHRFVPNDLGDGVRWQSNINWNNDEVPLDGDNVDLGGNIVHFGGTSTVADLALGANGELEIAYGKLTVTGEISTGFGAGALEIKGAGQLWTEGLSPFAKLEIDAASGRFANTGDVAGDTVLVASDTAQILLGVDTASYTITEAGELRLVGSDVRAGFDGETNGVSVLGMKEGATLTFVGDEGGFATITEFRSGALGDDVEVKSGVSLDGTLQVDLSGMDVQSGMHTLVDVDALRGAFDDINIYGLGENTDAIITVDYEIDAVLIQLAAGNGDVSVDTIGNGQDGTDEDAELWDAVTAGQTDLDSTIPDISSLSVTLPDPDQAWL